VRRAVNYKPDTIYRAVVNTNETCCRIFFLFSRSRVCVGEDIHRGHWSEYVISAATEIHHVVPKGIWILYLSSGEIPRWIFRDKNGHIYDPMISLADETRTKEEVKQAAEWYEITQGVDFSNPLQPKIKFTGTKEVKNKMYLHLIQVIFFNRQTKKIEYEKDIVAKDEETAFMLAAQDFKKYDPKVHVKHAYSRFGFDEKGEVEEED